MDQIAARARIYRQAQTNAAELARQAALPGPSLDVTSRAERAAADVVGMRARMTAMGDPDPVTASATVAVIATAPAKPVPSPKPRNREEAIRFIAASAPISLPDDMAAEAIASGQNVDAFAVAVADHVLAVRAQQNCEAETERLVAAILAA